MTEKEREKLSQLSRPEVKVSIPRVNLSLKDLAFLRSLSQPKSVRCFPNGSTLDRLRFLDLIARAKVPKSKEEIQKITSKIAVLKAELQLAVSHDDWKRAQGIVCDLIRQKDYLEPREDDVLTAKGEQILITGEVTIKTRKVGCV